MELIIGTVVLVALVTLVALIILYNLKFGNREKPGKKVHIPEKPVKPPLPPLPPIPSDPEYSDWRATWRNHVDTNNWIPGGKAKDIMQRFPPFRNGSGTIEPVMLHSRFEKILEKDFRAANAIFLTRQKNRLNEFFSSVERNPLTDEQKDCCICMDNVIQIVAAAGSGKTSTIIARVGYVLKEGLASPGEILILAFNRSVKKEIETRIKERLGNIPDIHRISVKTFHAFGLEVIGKSAGQKVKLAGWVAHGKDVQAISDVVESLCKRDPRFRRDWDMFRIIYGRNTEEIKPSSEVTLMENGKGIISTVDGKWVKSHQERMICDFLFYHGVPYEYERVYEHNTGEHPQYRPDFYYPRAKLYHEHFVLNRNGNAPPRFSNRYISDVHWKRALHEEKGTRLFETTSFGMRDENDLDRLKSVLEQHGEVLQLDEERTLTGQKLVSSWQLASTIRAFQQHVKSNRMSHQDLHRAVLRQERGHRIRLKRFVTLYERIADEWQRRLHATGCVDFDDMLVNAVQHIETGVYQSPYSMVLADEFQDVSQARLRLLKALKDNAGPSANLCVVGDDWQGINRFAGADISVMTGFGQTFPNATQLTLTRTFRCPKILCDASSRFIQKNPRQIKKNVRTTNTYEKAGLHVFAAVDEIHALEQMQQDLRYLCSAANCGNIAGSVGAKLSVMLLGRYNNNKPACLKEWQREFGAQLKIGFSTVHAAKGMEADYVMLLNVVAGGFPSEVVDDPVLQIAMPDPDDFPMAEERRLFYVALTRARRETRIYTLQDRPSRFVIEIANDGYTWIKTGNVKLEVCPECGTGVLRRKEGKFGAFESCSAYPDCKYTRNCGDSAEESDHSEQEEDDVFGDTG